MSDRVTETKAILASIGPLLERYHGGMPVGFMAAIAQVESGGRMVAGDASLGEYGIFQVAANTPPSFGYPADLRTSVEGNVFLAALEYAVHAVVLSAYDPRIKLGSEDSWKVARLGFAIGMGGTRKLLDASRGIPGTAWQAIVTYVDTTPGMSLGSQSPAKVRDRVHLVDTVWAVGQAARPGAPGIPVIPPPPQGLPPPSVKPDILSRIAKARTAQLLALAAAAAIGAWLYWRS